MANLNGFNASQVEPAADFEPLPAGKYLAVITASEMKPTKNAQGKYLQLTFQVLEGPFKNRYVWARLNLENPNQTAVQIAKAELSALCRATGILTPKDSQELHHVPLVITVKLKKHKETGEWNNEIKGFAAKATWNAAAAAMPGAAPTSAPAAPAANPHVNTAAPWRR